METKIFKNYKLDEGQEHKCLAISYSQLDNFLTCPRQWFYKYLQGLGKNEETEATELGTQVHASIEEYCKQLQDGYEWTVAEAVELVSTNLEKRSVKFEPELDKELINVHKTMMEDLVKGGSKLGELLEECEIVSQEMSFLLKVKLPFTVIYSNERYNEVYINGFIDLVLRDKTTGGYIVVDHKSGKTMFKPYKLKKNLQLPIYSLVIKDKFGKIPERCCYFFTRFNELQDVEPLAESEDQAKKVYYKTGAKKGQLKSKQRTVQEIENTLIDVFKSMYKPSSGYPCSASALCSWCLFGAYGDLRCSEAQFYLRNDIPLPKENTVKI